MKEKILQTKLAIQNLARKILGFLHCKTLSSKNRIIYISLAFLFSLPIYVMHLLETALNISTPLILGDVLALFSIFIYIIIPKKHAFIFGFFVGIFWFYWTTLSFRFMELGIFLWPLIILAICVIGVIYGLIFWLALMSENIIYRIIFACLLPFIRPFDFNWLNMGVLFSYSHLGVRFYELVFAIVAVFLARKSWLEKQKILAVIALICVICAIDFTSFKTPKAPPIHQDIIMVQTNISQDSKWQKQYTKQTIKENIALIKDAIKAKKHLIIFPESAFPFVMEQQENLMQLLCSLSRHITIIAPALSAREDGFFNSSFVFKNARVQVIDKVILAPFGEYIPLPTPLKNLLAPLIPIQEFDKAQNFRNIYELGVFFRHAICYEASDERAYVDSPKFLIALSNNAWFAPSIEPSLQKMLLNMFSRIHHTNIFHVANKSKSYTIFR